MKRGTLLLLAVMAGLLVLLWKKKEEEIESGGPRLVQYPLWSTFQKERVTAVRIDHVQRGVQLKLERDAQGSWFLTDPVPYPAIDSLVRTLLRTLDMSLGIPDVAVTPADVGLSPPLVVLELTQLTAAEDGSTEVLRVELGSVALDDTRVYARLPQHASAEGQDAAILRIPRTIFNTLDRNPNDYRETRATHLRVEDVKSLKRRGEVYLGKEEGLVQLGLEARLTARGWLRTDGQRVKLSDDGMALVARGAAELKVTDFLDDAPRSYAVWGLDPPLFTVELGERDGSATTLHFGHLPVEIEEPAPRELTWTCRREGFEHVFGVAPQSVLLLARPADDLYEYQLMSAFRRELTRLEAEADGRKLVFERQDVRIEDPPWSVFELRSDGVGTGVDGAPPVKYEASKAELEDAIALLERLELGTYPGVPFVAEEGPPMGFRVETSQGRIFAGRLGRPQRDAESGAPGRLFLRAGDELCAWIPETIVEGLLRRPLDHFRSRTIYTVGKEGKEAEVRSVELTRGDTSYRYINDGQNQWLSANHVKAPAAFVAALEKGLLTLRAERWLDPTVAGGPNDPGQEVSLWIRNTYGGELRFALGRTSEGTPYCRTAEGRLAEVAAPVLEELLKLFSG